MKFLNMGEKIAQKVSNFQHCDYFHFKSVILSVISNIYFQLMLFDVVSNYGKQLFLL